MEKNNNALFFTCSLIEFIARKTKNSRCDVVIFLGKDLKQIYSYADVFHCEPMEKVANDFIERNNILQGNYDVISNCKYTVPDYWDIGEVFERLIEDNYEEREVLLGVKEVYASWIAEKIVDFNSDLYYQSREYLSACYREGKLLTA